MKGFGRNVKLLLGEGHRLQIIVYLAFFLVLAFFAILDIGALPQILEIVATFFLLLVFGMAIIIMGIGDVYSRMMVYFGSSRRPAAWAMLLGQYVFFAEQMIILFVVAAFIESNVCMAAVRACPLGVVAVMLALAGIGHFINAMSISGHMVCAWILAVALAVVPVVTCVVLVTVFEISAEMLVPYNNIWILMAGLAATVIGAIVYFKTVTKVDLKLT